MATFDLDTFWLKINYFKLTHVEDLRKWWVIIFIAVDIFLLVFCLTNVILFVVGLPRQQQLMQAMAADTVNYQAIRSANTPRPVRVVSTVAIPVGAGKYDLVAKIKNENASWAATGIVSAFTFNGKKTASTADFILPNSEKYITALGLTATAGASGEISASFAIDSIRWQRIPDQAAVQRTQFIVEDVDFSVSGSVDKTLVQQVTANVSNTGYTSFWQAKFVVVCWQGDTIVGVSSTVFNQFRSGESKTLHVSVTVSGAPNRVEVLPDVNMLDAENLIT